MKVLVVDDEPPARAKLRRLLAAHADVAEVLEAADAPQALALMQRTPGLALAIVDIEMPGGSCLQLAALRPAGLRWVFSTAHAQHALQAFELGADDYLLKPYTPERLAAALARVREHLGRPAATEAPGDGQVWVGTQQARRRIRPADVQWAATADNYVALHLPPEALLERTPLAALLEQPPWRSVLLRVHRSHAVNPAHVMAVRSAADGDALLELRCGEHLRLSRRYRDALPLLLGP